MRKLFSLLSEQPTVQTEAQVSNGVDGCRERAMGRSTEIPSISQGYMVGTNSDSVHTGPLLWNPSTSAVSNSVRHSSAPHVGPMYQCEVPPFKPVVVKFDLNVICCSELEVDGMDVDERLFGYGLPVPLMPKGHLVLKKDTSNTTSPHRSHQLKVETTSSNVEGFQPGEDSSCLIGSIVKSEPLDHLAASTVRLQTRDTTMLQSEVLKSQEVLYIPVVDAVQGGPALGMFSSAQSWNVGCHVERGLEITRRKKRKKGIRRNLKKVSVKKETSVSSSDQASSLEHGVNTFFVPGIQCCTWNDSEAKGYTLALFLFGKDFGAVERFFEVKSMQEILHFYYSKFYGSPFYKRWSRAIRGSTKYVYGSSLVTGWRQEQLLSRLAPYATNGEKADIAEDIERFNNGKLSVEHLILRLKSVVGIEHLVQAVGLGTGKYDLTIVPHDPIPARVQVSSEKSCPILTTQEIKDFLTGDHRRSKARAQELFMAAVWPRLLAGGWRSQESDGELHYSRHPSKLIFLKPSHEYSRGLSVEGVDYFSSVTDVLSLVAQNPEWLEPAKTGVNSCQRVGKRHVSACIDGPSVSSDHGKFGTKGSGGMKEDASCFNFWASERRTSEVNQAPEYGKSLCRKSLADPNVSSYRVFLSPRKVRLHDGDCLRQAGHADRIYEVIKLGYKASFSLLVRSLVSPRSLQRLEIPLVMTTKGWCPAVGSKRSWLCEHLKKDCSLFKLSRSVKPTSLQSDNMLEGDGAWTGGSVLVVKASGAWTLRLATWGRQFCLGGTDSNQGDGDVVGHVPASVVGPFEPYRNSSTVWCPESASSASCVTGKAEGPGAITPIRPSNCSLYEHSCSSSDSAYQSGEPKYASDNETVKTEPLSLEDLSRVMVELKGGYQTISAAYCNNFAESTRRKNRCVAPLLKYETSVACQSASSQAPVSVLLKDLKVGDFTTAVAESGQNKRQRQGSKSPHQGHDGNIQNEEVKKATTARPSQANCRRSNAGRCSPKRSVQELDVRDEALSRNTPEDLCCNWLGAAKRSKLSSPSHASKDEEISLASQQLMLDFVYLLRSGFPANSEQSLEAHQVVEGTGIGDVKNKGKRSKRSRNSRRATCWSSSPDLEEELLLGDGVSASPSVQTYQRRGVVVTKSRRRRRPMGLGNDSGDFELTPPCMRSCAGTAFTSLPFRYSSGDLLGRKRASSPKHSRVERSIGLPWNTPIHETRFSSPSQGCYAGRSERTAPTPREGSPLLRKTFVGRRKKSSLC